MTLADRAAEFFGLERKDHTVIRLNRDECVLVAPGPHGRTLVTHYSERFHPTGTFIFMTERARAELVHALDAC